MPTQPSSADPTDNGARAAVQHLWYEPLVGAARDLERLTSAYHAELLVATLLGSVYTVAAQPTAGDNRGTGVERFAAGFREYLLAHPDQPRMVLLRAVLDSLVPPTRPGPQPDAPAWVPRLGTATVTATSAYGDGYGDQINYLLTCVYPDPELGGPEHVVSILVDRNLGTVKDLFVAAPASVVHDRLREAVLPADGSYLVDVDPGVLRTAVTLAMAATDTAPQRDPDAAADGDADGEAGDPPDGDDSFAADRAVAVARLRLLPVPPAVERDHDGAGGDDEPVDIAGAFRDSPEAERLVGAPGDAASLVFCLDLIERFAAQRIDRNPLRWSPTAARMFLLDWLPRQAVLDATDRALLPRVLDAWVRWAGRISGLPPALVAATAPLQ